jgi:hypothetical protein
MPEIKAAPRTRSQVVPLCRAMMAYPAGVDPAEESSRLPNRFCYCVIVGTSSESEHNDEMLAENEPIV